MRRRNRHVAYISRKQQKNSMGMTAFASLFVEARIPGRAFGGGAEGILMVRASNHFEPSTSAIPSCLRVSSLLKFVIPFRSANPLRFGLLEPLAGTYPCRHPWLDTVTPFEFIGASTAPHLVSTGSAPAPHPQRVAITVMAECESTYQPRTSLNPTRIILSIDGLVLKVLAQDRADR
jgi:hypothetical protein